MALFKPGQSGNPSGRPAVPASVTAACRAHTDAAIAVLVAAMDDVDARVRVVAANSILDRAWGKATTIVEATVRKAESLHEEQARLLAESFIESQRRITSGATEPNTVHDSVPAGLSPR